MNDYSIPIEYEDRTDTMGWDAIADLAGGEKFVNRMIAPHMIGTTYGTADRSDDPELPHRLLTVECIACRKTEEKIAISLSDLPYFLGCLYYIGWRCNLCPSCVRDRGIRNEDDALKVD